MLNLYREQVFDKYCVTRILTNSKGWQQTEARADFLFSYAFNNHFFQELSEGERNFGCNVLNENFHL